MQSDVQLPPHSQVLYIITKLQVTSELRRLTVLSWLTASEKKKNTVTVFMFAMT